MTTTATATTYTATHSRGRVATETTRRVVTHFVIGYMGANAAHGASGSLKAAKGMASNFRKRGYVDVEVLEAVTV